MTLPLCTLSPPEASNCEICQNPVFVLTYNTVKGFKMKQDIRCAGYSESESNDCTLQKRVQQANNRFLEEVQHQTIVLPTFVDTKDQSMASMLTMNSSKMNLD